MRYVVKHSLADSSAFTYSAELELEKFPDNQVSYPARHTRTDVSKTYRSPSTSNAAKAAACNGSASCTRRLTDAGASGVVSSMIGNDPGVPVPGFKAVSVNDERNKCIHSMIGQDAAVPVPGFEAVVLAAYRTSLSGVVPDNNNVERHDTPPPSLSLFQQRIISNGVSSMDKLPTTRCNRRARKLLGQDAALPVPGSETVDITDSTMASHASGREHHTEEDTQHTIEGYGLRNKWGQNIELAARQVVRRKFASEGKAFHPLLPDMEKESLHSTYKSTRCWFEQNLGRVVTLNDRCNRRARKLLGQDAALPVPGSETVCLTSYHTSFSGDFPENKDVGSTKYSAEFSKPLKVRGLHITYNSSESSAADNRCNTRARKLMARDAVIPSPDSEQIVPIRYVFLSDEAYVGRGMMFPPSPIFLSYGSVLSNDGVSSMDKLPTTRCNRRARKLLGQDAALPVPGSETVHLTDYTSRPESKVYSSSSLGSAGEEEGRVLGAMGRAYNSPQSFSPYPKLPRLKADGVSAAGLLAAEKKAATKGYARRLLELIPDSSSENVSLTGYTSLSKEVAYSNYESFSEKRQKRVLTGGPGAQCRGHDLQYDHNTPRVQTTMLNNDVNSMLRDENGSLVTAPFEGRALTQEEIPNIRRAGIRLIDRALSMQTPSSAIRKLEFEDVKTGDAALKDLHRSFLHIYGVHDDTLCISSINFLSGVGGSAPQKSATSLKSSLEEYPSNELCDLLSMTKEEYKSNLDRFGYRAITATALKKLIHSAAIKKHKSVTDIHPALIEELVTTVSQACICGFPSFEVQSSDYNLFIKHPPEKRHMTMKPESMGVDRGVYIDFKSENELSVYSHYYPTPWLGGYVATHIWYDVSVSPESGQLHYKNFVVRIAFPGVDKVYPEPRLRSKIDRGLNSVEEETIFHSLPRRMPVVGFMLEWNLPDETIPIVEMFDVRLARTTTIRDSVELIRKRLAQVLPNIKREEASGSELSVETQEEDREKSSSTLGSIKTVLVRLLLLVKHYISLIKKSISDLLLKVKQYCYKSEAAQIDAEQQSRPIEKGAVEVEAAVDISVSDKKKHIDLVAELDGKKTKLPSAVDTMLEDASDKKTFEERKREAQNSTLTHLGEEDRKPLHAHARRVKRRQRSRRCVAVPISGYPDAYLSDSSIDGVASRSRTLHVAARTR